VTVAVSLVLTAIILYAIPTTRIGFFIVGCRAGVEKACVNWATAYEIGDGVAMNRARMSEIMADVCARFRSQDPCMATGMAMWAGWSKQGGMAEAEALCTTDTGDDRYAYWCETLSTAVLGDKRVQGDRKEKAIRLAMRSCALGHANGCRLARNMDNVAERVRLLDRVGGGCERGDQAACDELIDIYKKTFGAQGAPP
jgi:hypothetical protein